ncbi:MAG: hypothetical protein GXP57_02030 [Deltaproteobacteria bacterium]|nr:hypothetical protein [Deltaproteobacteria bacterium]
MGEEQGGAHEICFGLNRTTDEESLAAFLRLFNRKELTSVLIPRMTDDEIMRIVDLLTDIMHNHLQEKEYHELFLGDKRHSA